jgi:hypothetical protein
MEAPQMYKAASQKISIFLIGFILLAWAAIVPPSLSIVGMHELSDGDMSAISGAGFSKFTLDGTGLATLDFDGITLSTYTEIQSMKMGYYTKSGTTSPWDNDWTSVSLGTSSTDLVAKGLYIKAQFTNYTDPATRQLDYLQIGATSLKGTIAANFNGFSGTILGTTAIPYNRSNLGVATITSDGTSGFNLTLDKNSGFSFNFGSGSHL